jgi:hypothetical protein
VGSRLCVISVSGAWQGGLFTGWAWNERWWWLGIVWMLAHVIADWSLPSAAEPT